MSKKLLMGLAPVLVVGALAMPGAAQAHPPWWYKSGGQLITANTPVLEWGQASMVAFTSGIGEMHCLTVGGGTVLNPAGGLAGTASIQVATFTGCKALRCEELAIESNLPLTSYLITDANAYPWHGELSGEPAANFNIGEPFTTFSGYLHPVNPAEIQMLASCETPPGFSPHVVAVAATFQGELKPFIGPGHNGFNATHPSSFEFKGALTGALHSEIGGEGSFTGAVKYFGYLNQEILAAE